MLLTHEQASLVRVFLGVYQYNQTVLVQNSGFIELLTSESVYKFSVFGNFFSTLLEEEEEDSVTELVVLVIAVCITVNFYASRAMTI